LKNGCNSNQEKRAVIVSRYASPRLFEATWEIRFGRDNCFRVLHAIDEEHRVVQIQAIGVKEGNRLLIAGQEVEL
jgi:hypothetical protein